MKCEIIRDLMPSYIDGLTSEASNAVLEEHVESCEECRKYMEIMRKELASEEYLRKSKEEIKADIQPFKKIKRDTRIKIITAVFTVLFTVTVLGCIAEMLFSSAVQASAEEIKITYERTDRMVRISFWSTKDSEYVWLMSSGAEEGSEEEGWNKISPVIYHRGLVWRSGPQGNSWSFVFVDEDTIVDQDGESHTLTGNEMLEVEYAGETKKVKIKDLYTEEGIKALR